MGAKWEPGENTPWVLCDVWAGIRGLLPGFVHTGKNQVCSLRSAFENGERAMGAQDTSFSSPGKTINVRFLVVLRLQNGVGRVLVTRAPVISLENCSSRFSCGFTKIEE